MTKEKIDLYDWAYKWIDKIFDARTSHIDSNGYLNRDEWKYHTYCFTCDKVITNDPPMYDYEMHPKYHRTIDLVAIDDVYEFLKHVSEVGSKI